MVDTDLSAPVGPVFTVCQRAFGNVPADDKTGGICRNWRYF